MIRGVHVGETSLSYLMSNVWNKPKQKYVKIERIKIPSRPAIDTLGYVYYNVMNRFQ